MKYSSRSRILTFLLRIFWHFLVACEKRFLLEASMDSFSCVNVGMSVVRQNHIVPCYIVSTTCIIRRQVSLNDEHWKIVRPLLCENGRRMRILEGWNFHVVKWRGLNISRALKTSFDVMFIVIETFMYHTVSVEAPVPALSMWEFVWYTLLVMATWSPNFKLKREEVANVALF